MPRLTIDDIIARFAEQLREAVRAEIERHAGELVTSYVPRVVAPRKPSRMKGLPVPPKPCPVCGLPNTRRRFSYYCDMHTPAGVGVRKPKALDVAQTVTSGSADV